MSFHADKDQRKRRQKTPSDSENAAGARPARRKSGQSGDVGTALRSVYQRTVDERIPPEMLDLLGKLD